MAQPVLIICLAIESSMENGLLVLQFNGTMGKLQDMKKPRPRNKRTSAIAPKKFKAIRDTMNLTQAELAAELGVGMRTIYHWEYGSRHIPTMAVRLLVCILDKSCHHHELVNELSEKISWKP